jgi:2-dehydro-3-deoxygluconokinase
MLEIKDKNLCRWDLVSLGEILLRFDPGERRIRNAREFTVWGGGAEFNVAANLSGVFRQRASIVTALHDNALGRLAEDFARSAGVDTSNIAWRNDARNGLYFIERGFGLRAPQSAFDREHTAVSRLDAGSVDWEKTFADGTRWFHTGGVFTGLSYTTPNAAIEAMRAAKESGAVVSYDLNYRNSLWEKRGGREAANAVNAKLLPFVDVLFGAFDFDSRLSAYDENAFRRSASKMREKFPNLKLIVSTLRETHSASRHDLGAVCSGFDEIHRSKDFKNIDVLDRVGSGDAFASAFIHCLLDARELPFALDCAAAHGALAMTSPGDVSSATADEVFALMTNADAAAKR